MPLRMSPYNLASTMSTVINITTSLILDYSTILSSFDNIENTTSRNYELSDFNLTLEEYIIIKRGAKTLSKSVVIPITVLYALIFLSGIIGNISVCTVIARNNSMHTSTNYYLFSLALSDLTILLLGLPNDLYVYWHQYPWSLGMFVCKLRALVSEATSYSSVLTIVAFSMERYLAICHPLHAYTMSGLGRASKIIACLWLVSLVCASPFAAYTNIHKVDFPPNSGNFIDESAFCAMYETPENFPIYEASSCIFFVIPMIILVVLYTRMAMRIRRRNTLGFGRRQIVGSSSIHSQGTSSQSSPKSIIRMLTAVVVTFFFCWAPFHTQRLLYVYLRESPSYQEHNEWIYHVTGCFYYFSATINPILYNLMSSKYRLAFKKTLCKFGRQNTPRRPILGSTRRSTRNQEFSLRVMRKKSQNGNGEEAGTSQVTCQNLPCEGGECSTMLTVNEESQQHICRALNPTPQNINNLSTTTDKINITQVTLLIEEKYNMSNSIPTKILMVLKNKVDGSRSMQTTKVKSQVVTTMCRSNSESELSHRLLCEHSPVLSQDSKNFITAVTQSKQNTTDNYKEVKLASNFQTETSV